MKKAMKKDFHRLVIERDGACQYHTLFHGNPSQEATYGDHIVTQAKSAALKTKPWNGIATCDYCNAARAYGLYGACVLSTPEGYLQYVWDKQGHAFGRLIAGEHTGEWKPIDWNMFAYIYRSGHAYDDKGQVLA